MVTLAAAEAFVPEARETMLELVSDGYVIHEGGQWKPTSQGWLCGNDLYGRLLDLAP